MASAWDKAVRGEHGGAREGAGRKPAVVAEMPDHDPETGEIKCDNVNVEKRDGTIRPTGNAAQQGLRRLMWSMCLIYTLTTYRSDLREQRLKPASAA